VLEDPSQPSHAEKRISSSYLRRIAIRTRLSDSVRLAAKATSMIKINFDNELFCATVAIVSAAFLTGILKYLLG
jgi:hypothetical protein